MLRILLLYITLFLYIFNIVPHIGPSKIGTRIYIGIIGLIYLISSQYLYKKTVLKLIFYNGLLVIFSLLTVIINNTSDIWYIQFAILNILYISGALLITHIFSSLLTSFYQFIELIIYCILANSVISFAGFIYNPIMLFITSIQELGNESLIEGTINFGVRALGFGSGNFFFGGVINGLGLIFICYLIRIKYFSVGKGITLLFLLFLTGMFIARTTIIGLFFSLFLLYYKMNAKRIGYSILYILCLFCLLLAFSSFISKINISWAFDFIINLFSEGKVSNDSLDTLDKMWEIEISSKTFLIGDGLSKYDDGSYYLHTDVGFLRNILYFGILGTIFGYFLYTFLVCKLILKEVFYVNNIKILVLVLYGFLLIVNYKGLPDYNFMLFLIISYFIVNKNKQIKNNVYS